MSNLSQDSPSKIMEDLAKQAQTLETTIHHRKSELATIKQEIVTAKQQSDLKVRKIRADSEALVDRLTEQTRIKLDKLQVSINEKDFELAAGIKQHEEAQNLLKPLLERNENLIKENKSLTDKNNKLEKVIEEQETLLYSLKDERLTIASEISVLKEDKETLVSTVNVLKADHHLIEEDIRVLKSEFESTKSKNEEQIAVLTARKAQILTDIEVEQKKIENALHDIATRHKILEDRDQNIRIREAKVETGENSIMRNSELLNL